jgi:hypothetical protein
VKAAAYLFLLPVFYFLALFCNKQTGGFSILRITPLLPDGLKWDTTPLTESECLEVESALKQSFHYLGCGGQCYAFASEDGRYVIKFFITPFRLFSSHALQTLPIFSTKKCTQKTKRALSKLQRDFSSYQIANDILKEETGVLYMHLTKSTHLKKQLRIVDKLGIAHTLDLDQFAFAIQRKADLAFTHLRALIESGELELAKAAMRSLIALCIERDRKGIDDHDAKIHRNFGFIENRPLFIDIGRFVHDASRKEKEIYLRDAKTIATTLRSWIEEHYPHLTPYFHEALY